MAGNLSLQHELEMLTFANMLVQNNAFTDQFRARIGLEATEPIRVHIISMSEELLLRLDYPSKLSRNPRHIARLVADGEAQAGRFLAEFDQMQRAA
jgi:NTE family protein